MLPCLLTVFACSLTFLINKTTLIFLIAGAFKWLTIGSIAFSKQGSGFDCNCLCVMTLPIQAKFVATGKIRLNIWVLSSFGCFWILSVAIGSCVRSIGFVVSNWILGNYSGQECCQNNITQSSQRTIQFTSCSAFLQLHCVTMDTIQCYFKQPKTNGTAGLLLFLQLCSSSVCKDLSWELEEAGEVPVCLLVTAKVPGL